MAVNNKIGGPFGVPGGPDLRFENPDGVGWAGPNGSHHNVYDTGNMSFPLLVAGDYENVREVSPELPDSFRS